MRIVSMRSSQIGIGMIEVLIAVLVLAVGALGFAGVQLVAMQKSEDANYRSAAMLIAQDAVERIQANSAKIDDYRRSGAIATPASAPSQTCGAGCDVSGLDLSQLAWSASQTLPNGQIKIDDCDFNGLTCVVLNWGERDGAANSIDACTSIDGVNLAEDSNCLVMEFVR
ncbi:type IV pilus modification protein PilV [Pseudomonas sp. 5Ae-yellow]|nr:type IV pilus modification protein PilV [Pseudomonas sp. 5Ae-yellow]|tara:strand:+ start:439 stop:945 length:507 start_codon:yes stop_codon:yes gene_type:complete